MSDYPASMGYQADCRINEGATNDLATWPVPAAPIENPKTLVGRTKTPSLAPVPATSLAWLAEAHADGARKYGPLNWRDTPIPLTVYIDAAIRHLLALKEGEDVAADSGLPHAAHVMAGMSIVLDAAACGTLIDDRVNGRPDAFSKVQEEILAIRARRAA